MGKMEKPIQNWENTHTHTHKSTQIKKISNINIANGVFLFCYFIITLCPMAFYIICIAAATANLPIRWHIGRFVSRSVSLFAKNFDSKLNKR